jgi:hypothetical protein
MVVYLTQQNNETLFINYKKIKNMKTLTKFIKIVKTEIKRNGWEKIKGQIHTDYNYAVDFIKAGENPPLQLVNRIEENILFLTNKK